jgi:hypothetical protein
MVVAELIVLIEKHPGLVAWDYAVLGKSTASKVRDMLNSNPACAGVIREGKVAVEATRVLPRWAIDPATREKYPHVKYGVRTLSAPAPDINALVTRPQPTGVAVIDEQIERLRQHEIEHLGKRPRAVQISNANLAIQRQYTLAVLAHGGLRQVELADRLVRSKEETIESNRQTIEAQQTALGSRLLPAPKPDEIEKPLRLVGRED